MSDTPRTDELRDKLVSLGWNPHKDKPVSDLFVEMDKLERKLADMTKQIDPYEREAAKAAINVLKRELADMTKQRDALAALVDVERRQP